MHGLLLEEHSFGANPGTKDLARHLYTRSRCGKVVIVAENPVAIYSALRRQWLKLCRKVQKERASTLNAERIYELSQTISHMQKLEFTHEWPGKQRANVYVATIEELLRWTPENCRTLYVTCDMQRADLHIITSLMRPYSLVVMCELANQA